MLSLIIHSLLAILLFYIVHYIREFFTDAEIEAIMAHVKLNLFPKLEDTVRDWRLNYNSFETDADSYYSSLTEALLAYRKYFKEDASVTRKLTKTVNKVKRLIEDASADLDEEDEQTYDFNENESTAEKPEEDLIDRRIFDDIDA